MRPSLVCLVWFASSAAGCFGADASDLHGVEMALGAASSIAQASSIAMNAIADVAAANTSISCVTVMNGCSGFPCQGAVEVRFGGACPLPLGAASGTVSVSGSWSSASDARLEASFTSVAAGARGSVVVDATSVTVTRSPSSVSVSYVGQDVRVRGGDSLTAQAVFKVLVDTASTPDPADDRNAVDVTLQNVSGSVSQLNLSGVTLASTCRLNPTAGSATIQYVGLTSIKQEQVSFHDACDGTADVKPTAGGTQKIALDFLR